MEDERKELEILKEGIQHLQKALNCFVCCDSITEKEYGCLVKLEDDLTSRKIDLEIKINGCIIQED